MQEKDLRVMEKFKLQKRQRFFLRRVWVCGL
jgi:hypothetical protein